ncbi:MAG: transposase [Rhodoferax sp.]|nr:transposase [Rhodoferax sp.]
MRLMGLGFETPDRTLMSRRAEGLQMGIPRKQRTEPIHISVDSTELKVYAEGEWMVRKHGASKRRS